MLLSHIRGNDRSYGRQLRLQYPRTYGVSRPLLYLYKYNRDCLTIRLNCTGPLKLIKPITFLLIIPFLVLASSCATQSYGRVAPVVPVEQSTLDCESLEYEYAKVSGFCGHVLDNGYGGDDCAKGVAIAFIPIVGLIHNVAQSSDYTETLAAIKSGNIRSAQLEQVAVEKKCDLSTDTRCSPLCERNATSAVLTMENGFCGLRCVTLNRKEHDTYSDLISKK